MLTVFDAAGQEIDGNDDDPAGGTLDSRVVVPVVAGQTYFVRAAAFGPGTGAYDLVFGDPPTDGVGGAEPITLSLTNTGTQFGDLEDAGEADFFRCDTFLAAEAVTHTLRVRAGGLAALVPLIVRDIPGSELRDAVSPYGYPGATVVGDGPAPAAGQVEWSQTGLVSVFARERLGTRPWLAGSPERSRVLVHDPSRPRSRDPVRPRPRATRRGPADCRPRRRIRHHAPGACGDFQSG